MGGSNSSEATPWAPEPPKRPDSELPTLGVVGGSGRMGVHLCAAWANAGYDVTLCSRTKEKAQAIVDELLAGRGYQKKVEGALAGQGDYCVPPCPADQWKLQAGDVAAAAEADVIILGATHCIYQVP
jgi:predicted dinucleotide-binding enzyme